MVELGEASGPLGWLQVQIMQSNETDRQSLVAATSYNWFLLLWQFINQFDRSGLITWIFDT